MARSGLETELKFAVADLAMVRGRLQAIGATSLRPPVFEENVLYDDAEGSIGRRHELLRVRRSDDVRLTWKQPVRDPRFKVRREVEVRVDDFEAMSAILEGLGYRPVRRYQKEREAWHWRDAEILLDRTPIGAFVEIEAQPDEIEAAAAALGLDVAQGLTASYLTIYAAYCRERGLEPGDMVFDDER